MRRIFMINGSEFIAGQLAVRNKTEVVFEDGRKTVLTPVKYVPSLNGENRLLLDGEWNVLRWPFKRKETTLVSVKTDDSR